MRWELNTPDNSLNTPIIMHESKRNQRCGINYYEELSSNYTIDLHPKYFVLGD